MRARARNEQTKQNNKQNKPTILPEGAFVGADGAFVETEGTFVGAPDRVTSTAADSQSNCINTRFPNPSTGYFSKCVLVCAPESVCQHRLGGGEDDGDGVDGVEDFIWTRDNIRYTHARACAK